MTDAQQTQQPYSELWPINRLTPYIGNPRKNDQCVKKMAAIIDEFGFINPVIVKADGEIIDGHLRVKAARYLGLKEIPVVIADHLDDSQAKAFRIAANKTATWAENDETQLKRELKELSLRGFDLSLTGFADFELDVLVDVDMKPLTGRLGKFGIADKHNDDYAAAQEESLSEPAKGFEPPPQKVVLTFVMDRDEPEYAAWVKFKDAIKVKEESAVFRALLRTVGDA